MVKRVVINRDSLDPEQAGRQNRNEFTSLSGEPGVLYLNVMLIWINFFFALRLFWAIYSMTSTSQQAREINDKFSSVRYMTVVSHLSLNGVSLR